MSPKTWNDLTLNIFIVILLFFFYTVDLFNVFNLISYGR